MDAPGGRWGARLRGMRAGFVIGAALALVGVAVGTAAGVDTPFQKVLVVNAPASPIPVTGTINVGNTPSNQNVTVSNFPATQPVTGTVSVSDKVSRFFTVHVDLDGNFDTDDYDFPGGAINVTSLTLSSFSDDSMDVVLISTTGHFMPIHSGEGFSRDFTLPVPISKIRVTCTNEVLSCSAYLTVWGT